MPFPEFTPFEIAFGVFALFLGGLVKGAVGLGMKAIALGLLATVIELRAAIALIIVPGIASNIWQIFGGPPLAETLRRTWSLFVLLCVGIWLGTEILVAADPAVLTTVLGILLVLYAGCALLAPQIPRPGRHEIWMSPAAGGLTGIFSGMTGSDVMPAVPYMQSLDLGREMLIQAMGILFLLGSLAIAVAFLFQGLLPAELGVASALGAAPTLAGYCLGARFRRSLPEARFRRLLLGALLLLGIYIVASRLL